MFLVLMRRNKQNAVSNAFIQYSIEIREENIIPRVCSCSPHNSKGRAFGNGKNHYSRGRRFRIIKRGSLDGLAAKKCLQQRAFNSNTKPAHAQITQQATQ